MTAHSLLVLWMLSLAAHGHAQFKPAVAQLVLDRSRVRPGGTLQATYTFRSSGRRAGWDGSFPDRLEGTLVDRQGLRLQFLDAAGLPETNGTLIGRHCVNCADGQPAEEVAFSWTDETSKNATYG